MRGPLIGGALAGALALASAAGHTPLTIAVVVAQALLILGWYEVIDVPGRVLGSALAGAAGLAADVAMRAKGDEPSLGPLVGVLGLTAVGAIVHQLIRSDGRSRVTASMSATLSLASLTVLAACLIAERGAVHGETVTMVVVLAAGAATAVLALPAVVDVGVVTAEVAALVAGFALGAVAGGIAGDLAGGDVAALAFAGGGLAVVARLSATYAAYDAPQEAARAGSAGGPQSAPPTRRPGARRRARHEGESVALLGSALPVVLVGPAAYILGRLLVG